MFVSKEFLGILAGLISILAFIPYVVSIRQGKMRPSISSWIIWTVASLIVFVGSISKGAGYSVLLPLGLAIGDIVIVALTFRSGKTVWSKLDRVCLGIALMSLIPWAIFHSPLVTLIINVAMMTAGGVPTLVKVWRLDGTESLFAWTMWLLGGVIAFMSVEEMRFIYLLYPGYVAIANLNMVVALVVYIARTRKLKPVID